MKKLLLLVTLFMFATLGAYAQDNTDFGLWNDVQVTKSLDKKTDVVGGVRFDTKRDTRSFAEQRAYGGFNFKEGNWSVQPMLVFLKNFSKKPYYEFRPQVTVSYKIPINKGLTVTPRVRAEYHFKNNGLKNDGRIVPIINVEKRLSKKYGIFQTTEVWFPIGNSKDVAKYRQRYFFGISRNVNTHLTVDAFYLFQRDEQVAPRNNHKLGLTWKIRY